MRMSRLKKKMLTMVTFTYAAILVMSVAYAAVNGMITFTGTATTTADLEVQINNAEGAGNSVPNKKVLPSVYGSTAKVSVNPDKISMVIDVELNAPGDMTYILFDFINTGKLPAEFEEPIIIIDSVPLIERNADGVMAPVLDNEGNPVMVEPVYIEDYSVAAQAASDDGTTPAIEGILGFEDLDGYVLQAFSYNPDGTAATGPVISEKFGMAFVWDEDVHIETEPGNPLKFTVEFPYIIAEIG